MLEGVEITTPWATFKRIRQAIKGGLKLWENARFIMADVPLNQRTAGRILPWGMKLADPPTATVFVANYTKTAFFVAYKEAAVLLHVNTPLGRGFHCCWMVVDDDTALIYGRDFLGYPKKMADIYFEEEENRVRAGLDRRGIRVLAMEGRKTGTQNPPPPVFDRKTFNVGGPGQFSLVQPIWMFRAVEDIRESYTAEVDLSLSESEYDPLSRLAAGNPRNGRMVVLDILNSKYQVPVGLSGPRWFLKTFSMRYR